MTKLEFHFLLGERQIPRHYDLDDYRNDLENIEQWDVKEPIQHGGALTNNA